MKKEEYDKIKEKHPELPTYEELDKEFEISDIDKKNYLLRHIRRRIIEKMERLIEIMQSIIQPDPASFIDMYECRTFNETEKKEIFELCRTLMYFHRMMLEEALKREEIADVRAINAAYREWTDIRDKIVKYLGKLKECWKKEIKTREILDYMG